ncbi:glycoside hydrolase family 2 protein [Aureobasidium subglaciale EXF-2481]|uniref:Beta-mannosidase A n=1 Tax=Aureobasidium subglaciale (strain EXF-2481) TaxID=1043005 RepID=A0A074Y2X6_AURSE|nr:glycoside hydrolase family 2 protein [Aureobasidium subglaciale EXF-2481]KEQ90294.1 glycoside hydrolase family 2 protein [Aureobasidium subglaciale EXF-2481]
MLFYIAAAITAIASKTIAQSVISLSGHDWTLTNPDLNISCPASLPSQAHLDLHACQVIGSPYYGLNDFNLRWFRQYYFDVSSVLESCQSAPVLSVNFGSAPKITQEIADEPGQETWPYGIEIMYEFPNRQFMRKEQNDFGWDWGPAFAPAGPWQPAWVVQLDNPEVYIRNSLIDIFRRGQLNNLPPDQSQPWTVNASLDYIGTVPQSASLRYSLSDLNNTIISSGYLENINITSSTLTGSTEIDPSLVELWWPSGLGPQNLYNMTITLNDGSKSNNTITSITKRTGFRTIVLNENPISQEQLNQGIAPGNNWHFEINGHEFYAKGSNFIPPDPFWPAVTEARMRDLLDAVVEGNQNMLRVWSSGAYLPDWLYDLGDEYGILLWSEFEFGDALYPVDELFLENVREEAEYNVRRVNHHPSLAAWMGGNELENLELANVNNTAPEQYDRYVAEYEKLFLDTLLPVVFGNSRSISYAPSSTSNGWLELNFSNPIPIVERYNNLTEGSVYGETDHYNYDPTVAFNLSSYPIGRFSNEFGYHSMPSLQSWEQVIPQSELYFNSSYVQLRNRHYPPGGLNATNYYNSSLGMGEMTRAAIEWYPVPNKSDSVANFSAWCHTTQIFQADFYRSQIEFYLRGSGLPERQLGSLYWQLEDQWTAPTWAGIEYDGRWKVLHYIAKDAYQPVIIASYYNVTTGDLEVYVTSDLWQAVSGSASFSWYDWSGDCLNISTPTTAEVNVGAINSTRVLSTNTFDILNSAGFNYSNVLMHMETTIQGQMPNSNESRTFTHENWFHASPLSSAALVDPGLQLSFSNTTKNFSITARSGIAAWVWLDYPLGAVVTFDSNGFWLLPNQTREVGYKVKSDSTGGAWIDDVTVESLYDNTIS